MTRIDDTRVPGTAEIYQKYKELLRKSARNEEGRLLGAGFAGEQNVAKGGQPVSEAEEITRRKLNSHEMEMAEAARDFEALFIQQMFSEMRRGLREDSVLGEEGGSLAADRNRNSFFRDRMYQNISQDMASQGGFGIGSVLFEQLYRQENPEILPFTVTDTKRASSTANVSLEEDSAASARRLVEEQKQVLRQRQSLTQLQLEDRFNR